MLVFTAHLFPAADPFLRQSIFGELELSLVILDTV